MINRRLISFEGPEGSGKSTQIKYLSERLIDMGEQVISVREPGGTHLGESIRLKLQAKDSAVLSNAAELLLFMSSRAQLVKEIILLPYMRVNGCCVIDLLIQVWLIKDMVEGVILI